MMLAIVVPAPQPMPGLRPLDWMIGCWETHRGTTRSRESWSRAGDDLLMGISYTVDREGKTKEFEFLRITTQAGQVVYLAQPSGNPVTVFTLAPSPAEREAIFSNRDHDFPKRVG